MSGVSSLLVNGYLAKERPVRKFERSGHVGTNNGKFPVTVGHPASNRGILSIERAVERTHGLGFAVNDLVRFDLQFSY